MTLLSDTVLKYATVNRGRCPDCGNPWWFDLGTRGFSCTTCGYADKPGSTNEPQCVIMESMKPVQNQETNPFGPTQPTTAERARAVRIRHVLEHIDLAAQLVENALEELKNLESFREAQDAAGSSWTTEARVLVSNLKTLASDGRVIANRTNGKL